MYLVNSAVFSQLLEDVYEKHNLFLVTSDNMHVYIDISLKIISPNSNLRDEY